MKVGYHYILGSLPDKQSLFGGPYDGQRPGLHTEVFIVCGVQQIMGHYEPLPPCF